jgi:hypothetical protein
MVLLESGSDSQGGRGSCVGLDRSLKEKIYGTVERRAYGRQRCS